VKLPSSAPTVVGGEERDFVPRAVRVKLWRS